MEHVFRLSDNREYLIRCSTPVLSSNLEDSLLSIWTEQQRDSFCRQSSLMTASVNS